MLHFGKFVKKGKKNTNRRKKHGNEIDFDYDKLFTHSEKDLLSDHNQAQKREKAEDCRFSHHQQILPQNYVNSYHHPTYFKRLFIFLQSSSLFCKKLVHKFNASAAAAKEAAAPAQNDICIFSCAHKIVTICARKKHNDQRFIIITKTSCL
jgi:hypothetical protein